MMKRNNKSIILILVALFVGMVLGGFFFGSDSHNHKQVVETGSGDVTYTCSMHPQIRQQEPGDCPICGMELIPVNVGGDEQNPEAVEMSNHAKKLGNIQVTRVSHGRGNQQFLLQGEVVVDEGRTSNQTAHISGRIEKLFVDFTGERVRKGQRLATLYSPELIAAQQEVIQAYKWKETQPALYAAARNKLKQWKLSSVQIDAIASSDKPSETTDLFADQSGIISEKLVNAGDYVNQGQSMFKLIDLQQVWIEFDAYEHQLTWLESGQSVQLSGSGIEENATIEFIDPVLDPVRNTAKVRVSVQNKNGRLKPGMVISGTVNSEGSHEGMSLPKTAVLWTGKRSVVYVQNIENPNEFQIREVELGAESSLNYIVTDGLQEGELVVSNGAFKVDAAAQLAGKPSMMSPDDSAIPELAEKHAHFEVSGNCEMCKSRIEKAAMDVFGVSSANWQSESQLIMLNFDSLTTNTGEIAQSIANSGHDNSLFLAPDEVYKELPGCCLYDRTISVQEK